MKRRTNASFHSAVAIAVLTCFTASAQVLEPPASARAIRDIADFASAAPPELGGDVLLKLVEGGNIVDPRSSRQLLETAWNLASAATHPFEIEPAVEAPNNSDAANLSTALATGLSTAGLQNRIIAQIAKQEPSVTRELFLQMSAPAVESPG